MNNFVYYGSLPHSQVQSTLLRGQTPWASFFMLKFKIMQKIYTQILIMNNFVYLKQNMGTPQNCENILWGEEKRSEKQKFAIANLGKNDSFDEVMCKAHSCVDKHPWASFFMLKFKIMQKNYTQILIMNNFVYLKQNMGTPQNCENILWGEEKRSEKQKFAIANLGKNDSFDEVMCKAHSCVDKHPWASFFMLKFKIMQKIY